MHSDSSLYSMQSEAPQLSRKGAMQLLGLTLAGIFPNNPSLRAANRPVSSIGV